MLRSRFLWRLYAGYVGLIILTIAIVGALVGYRTVRHTLADIEAELHDKARILAAISEPALVGEPGEAFQGRIRALGEEIGTRLTVIRADGVVVADSEEDPRGMDDHGDRPEVLQARDTGVGRATRLSDTLKLEMMYLALPVRRDGRLIGYVRASLPLTIVYDRLSDLRTNVIAGGAIASAIALVLGFVVARRFTRPLTSMAAVARKIASGETRSRVRTGAKGEMALLADSFNVMADQLQERLDTLTADRNKLHAVLASMVEGVVAVDRDERVVHMNAVAGGILGAEPEGSVGRPIGEVTRISEVAEALSGTMREMSEVKGEFRSPARGRDQVIELHAAPLRDSAGETAGAVVVLHDVTELRRLEAVRRDFVANVSHELKTPLTAIRGSIETVLDDTSMEEEARDRFLEKIRDQAGRLSALVGDFLTLSRIEAEEGALETSPVDLRDVLRESMQALSPEGEGKGIRLELSLPDEPVVVGGDAEALRQVADNLLGNAIKFTAAEGRVWLRLHADGSDAVIEVEDTGIGIEPRHQGRVFERFYRVDKARSRELGCTGLGLSIVKHIAVAHGGETSVESVAGKGSTFRVRLPLMGTVTFS